MTTEAERVTRLETVYEQVDRRLDSIDGRLDTMDRRLDSVDGRLDAMDRRFDGIDRRLEGMENRITMLMVASFAGWAVIAGAIIGAGFI
jgi:archaellum component FlaC